MISQDPKILGAIAYLGGIPAVPEPFAFAWGQMVACSYEQLCGPGQRLDLTPRPRISQHHTARNHLVKAFEGDWLMQFDTDHAPAPDTALLAVTYANRYKIDVLTGLYYQKEPPFAPCLWVWNEAKEQFDQIFSWQEGAELFEVDAAGGGCLFVRRSVFDRIQEELGEEPFAPMAGFPGEDFPFFVRLRRLGIKSYCAPAVKCPHLRWAESEPEKPLTGKMIFRKGVELRDA